MNRLWGNFARNLRSVPRLFRVSGRPNSPPPELLRAYSTCGPAGLGITLLCHFDGTRRLRDRLSVPTSVVSGGCRYPSRLDAIELLNCNPQPADAKGL
jgi:hypothetical protein